MSDKITCSNCGAQIDELAVFPGRRCIKCHSAATFCGWTASDVIEAFKIAKRQRRKLCEKGATI